MTEPESTETSATEIIRQIIDGDGSSIPAGKRDLVARILADAVVEAAGRDRQVTLEDVERVKRDVEVAIARGSVDADPDRRVANRHRSTDPGWGTTAVLALCQRCARQNAAGATQCSDCGVPLRVRKADVPTPRLPEYGAVVDDETTRLVTAAVHRHEQFCDALIREYLVEEVGAVPPSPGLDAVAVLRDAVAARARRRWRDAVVLVLLLALLVVDPVAVAGWTVLVVAVRRRFPALSRMRRTTGLVAVPAAAVLITGLALVKAGTGIGVPMGDRTWWPVVALGVALLLVLGADRYVVHRFLKRRFQPRTFTADLAKSDSAWERRLRSGGQRRYAEQLARVAAAEERSATAVGQVDVIVHRGSEPFVGAGMDLAPAAFTVQRRKRSVEPTPFDVYALHQHLATELRAPASDADRVLYRQQVMINTDALVLQVRRGTSDFAQRVLPDGDEPPLRHLPPVEAGAVAQDALPWARFYSCFRTESWSRNLAVSCYLHVTVRQGMVQFDLTSCVLPPIFGGLDEVDRVVRLGDGPVGTGAADLLALPLTVPARVRTVGRPLTPRTLRLRGIRPGRYGAGRSLREGISAGLEGKHWYEAHDARDMVAALDKWVLETTIDYLKDHGYDVSGLRRQVTTTINNRSINISGGHFVHTNIANNNIASPSGDDAGDE